MTVVANRPVGVTPLEQPEACEARSGTFDGPWRSEPLWCRQTRGLRHIEDAVGGLHAYCSAPGHRKNVFHRWAGR